MVRQSVSTLAPLKQNAFGKKAVNMAYPIALDFFHRNFCRVHQSLKMASAMKAGVARYPMTIEDLIEMPAAAGRQEARPGHVAQKKSRNPNLKVAHYRISARARNSQEFRYR